MPDTVLGDVISMSPSEIIFFIALLIYHIFPFSYEAMTVETLGSHLIHTVYPAPWTVPGAQQMLNKQWLN